ncbi:unnamed protein product [Rotaria socialis]|uniref:Reverse transcriptase domain-containing protein n=1 Tax=Rotaria socialis TaxID=392032 RepID=A0A817ZXM0_9BILA|nr:unnamed protein product [Rotaria socialis]CAF4507911.1 unnamed protein product [Rotaria socialis]
MVYSGASSCNKTKSAHGVAIYLDKQATNGWKDSGSVWEAVNERIIMIRLECKPIHATIIAVYSPINSNGNKQAIEEVDAFYLKLQQTVDKVPRGDMLLIMGDFNARVGKQQNQTTKNVIGPHTVDKINENGQHLIDFCSHNDIIVANTFYQHKTVHQMTWKHPGNKRWHMLDYTLVNKKFRSSVEDVRVYRNAAGAIGTDHHLVKAKLRLHLRCRKKAEKPQCLRLDMNKIKNDNLQKKFQEQLLNKLEGIGAQKKTVNEKYDEFVDYVKNLGGTIFKQEQNTPRKAKEWLTDEILNLVNEKAAAFVEWQNHRQTRTERKYRVKYCLLRKLVNRKIHARRLEYWDEVSEEIEKAIKQHDLSTAYRVIRQLKGGRPNVDNMPIQSKQGDLLSNSNDVMLRWREYFCDLLNVHSVIDPRIVQQISVPIISTTEQMRQDKPPSLSEVHDAIKQMTNMKAPGIDNISADLLKAGGIPMAKWVHEILCDVWNDEEVVEDWTTAILIRLYKNKGDRTVCGNYRGISLLVVTGKIFSRIILNRIQNVIYKQLLEQQAGFRRNKSTIDPIFTLKLIMEKSQEYNKSLFLCFIDIQKAYDSVDRKLLWKVCRGYSISDKLIRLLKLLHSKTKARVRINGELSESFEMETGVLQGGIISPMLFNIFFDYVIRRVTEEAGVNGVKLAFGSRDFFNTDKDQFEDLDVVALMYADDLVAISDNATDIERFIRTFEKVTQQCGLTMNVKKTCMMSLKQFKEDDQRRVIKGQEIDIPKFDITLRNENIELVEHFPYLGCIVSRDHSMEKEIETRLGKASSTFNMLRNTIWYRKSISFEAKFRIFRACVLPVLLYGSEIWSVTVTQERRINTFYMKCLRTIIGVNLGDRIANNTLLEITGQPHIENIMRRNRLRWFGHANRLNKEDNEPSIVRKIMFSYYPNVKRPRNGGIKRRWEDMIADDLNKCQIHNWRKDTLVREKWRELINKPVQTRPIHSNIKNIVQEYKNMAVKRRIGIQQIKVTEALQRNQDNTYTCPKCTRFFKPQGITNHVRACATDWCKQNKIQM